MKYYRSEKFWIEWLTVVPLAIALGFYFYGSSFYSSLESFLSRTLILVIIGTIISVLNHLVRFYALYYFHKLNQWTVRITLSLIAYLIVSLGISLLAFKLFSFFPFLVVTEEKKNISLLVTIFITIIGAILYEANTYYHQWKSAIAEEEQLEKLNLESQFQSLQGQLNPHFLFNSFNALQSLVDQSPVQAKAFIQELARVYRYVLDKKDAMVVPCGDEITFIKSFLYLNHIRFGDSLQASIELDNCTGYLPPLTLQLLVENAIKHNVISKSKPLHIRIYQEGNAIVVSNNLQLREDTPPESGIGHQNLLARYALLSATAPQFYVRDQNYVAIVPIIEQEM